MGKRNRRMQKGPIKWGLQVQNLAVKERFELSIQFPVYTLSRRAP